MMPEESACRLYLSLLSFQCLLFLSFSPPSFSQCSCLSLSLSLSLFPTLPCILSINLFPKSKVLHLPTLSRLSISLCFLSTPSLAFSPPTVFHSQKCSFPPPPPSFYLSLLCCVKPCL